MKKVVFALAALLSCAVSSAQVDLGLWTGVTVEKEISKKFEASFESQARFDSKLTNFSRWLNEAGVAYKVNKYYRVSTSYRLTFKGNQEFGHRISLNNVVRYKLEDFTFTYRLAFQSNFQNNEANDYNLRNKFDIEYKINKHLSPSISGEIFYNINYKTHQFNNYRLNLALEYNFNKHHKITPALIYNQEFNVADPKSIFIFSAAYKYSF